MARGTERAVPLEIRKAKRVRLDADAAPAKALKEQRARACDTVRCTEHNKGAATLGRPARDVLQQPCVFMLARERAWRVECERVRVGRQRRRVRRVRFKRALRREVLGGVDAARGAGGREGSGTIVSTWARCCASMRACVPPPHTLSLSLSLSYLAAFTSAT